MQGTGIRYLILLVLLTAVQAGFVRRRECSAINTASINPIFESLSLGGGLHTTDTVLWLKLMGDYHGPDCEQVDGEFAELLIDVNVLGKSIGHQIESSGKCPTLSPVGHFRSDPRTYSTYRASYALGTPHRLSTLETTIRLRLNNGSDVACVAANITPDLGPVASNLFKTIPLTIMVLAGLIAASIRVFRNRGSSIFRYEIANRAKDPVESFFPGVGECLQYIQFIFMSGCLTLSYPGFFKPVTSQLAWSSLIYANGPITHQFTYPGIQDGIYTFNGTYGLEEMAQILGATTMTDLWTNATINLSVMILAVVVFIQFSTLLKWMWKISRQSPVNMNIELKEDLIAHLHSAGWSVLRMILHYFIFPLVTYSLYQPLVAKFFPVYQTFLAVLLVSLLAVSLGFVVKYLGHDNRLHLLFNGNGHPTQLSPSWLSGALYGLPLIRGTAIGGLQISGTGQIVFLAACEIALIGCLLSSRQKGPVSVSIWKDISLSAVRLVTVLMCCAFIPSLGLGEGKKGLVGYAILAFHAAVMILGFFVISILEIIRFALGRLNDPETADEPPVFGLNQLSRRSKRNTSFSQLPALSPDPALTTYTYTPRSRIASSETSHSHSHSHSHSTEERYIYRPPRSNHVSSSPSEGTDSVRSSSSETETETDSRRSDSTDIDESGFERRSDVDYSVREADQYYRHRRREIVLGDGDGGDKGGSGEGGSRPFRWKRRGKEREKERGFEVVRPNMV